MNSNHRIAFKVLLAAAALLPGCKRADTSGDSGPGVVVVIRDGGPPDSGVQQPDSGPPYDAGPPVVVSVDRTSPNRGSVLGGTSVTISGSGFLSGAIQDPIAAATLTHVTFGGNPALRISVLSDSSLQTTTPPGVAGAADVEVWNPNNVASPAHCAGCFDYLATVQITGVSPSRGPTTGGTSFTVTGIGFLPGSVLLVGSHAAIQTVVAASGTSISGLSPPTALAGPVDVRVFNDSGVASLHSSFTYFALPTITSASPAGGTSLGGTAVTLKGTGFLNEVVTVAIGGQPASAIQVVDDQTITLVTPPGATGPADVQVQDAEGSATLTAGFVYYPAGAAGLALYGVVPNHGSILGGTSATVVGVGLSGANLALSFGGAAATGLTVIDDHLVQLVTPAGSAGSVAVGVSTSAGTASLPNGFTYDVEPNVLSVSPVSGPTAGGTSIQIMGSGFAAGDQVLVGPLAATSITLVGGTGNEIDAVTPAGTAGPALVQVISSNGASSTLVGGFTYVDNLALIQLNPTSGSQAGGTTVTLFGTGFGAGLGASFGSSVAVNLLLVDSYTATCSTPLGNPGPVDVTATEPGPGATTLSSTIKGGFSYFDPTNLVGGESGGPLNGTLNVTVLNGDPDPSVSGHPIPGAIVILGVDPNTPFKGPTDARGQITFSDPTIIKAQTVTVSDSSCANGVPCATTIDGVSSQNLTVFLDIPPPGNGMLPTPCLCGDPPDCRTNCNTNICGAMGTCEECETDPDCTNPAYIHPDPTAHYCLQGSCVHCVDDLECGSNPNLRACDDLRGLQSSFTCVQCNGEVALNDAGFTVDKFCSDSFYCNTNTLKCQPPDQINVTVYGFKPPAGYQPNARSKLVAFVGLVEPAVYFLEPFNPTPVPPAQPLEVEFDQDGVSELFTVGGPGNPVGAITLSLYARFGILDTSTAPSTFTPVLLGVTRGIQVDPLHPAVANIILDTHLDQTATLNLTSSLIPPAPTDGAATPPNPNPVQYDNFAYLDLGQDGVIPLGNVTAQNGPVTVPYLPPVAGNGVLFLTQGFQDPAPPMPAFNDPFQRSPTSIFFRRVQSDFSAGVDVGPFLSFLNVTHPDPTFPLLDGTFDWAFTDPLAPTPDLSQLLLCWGILDQSNQLVFRQVAWQIVVPGSQTSVSIPTDTLTQVRMGLPQVTAPFSTVLFWSLRTAKAPRFDFNYWSYQDLHPPQCLVSQPALSWTEFQSTYQVTF